jgi:hypothetical protein
MPATLLNAALIDDPAAGISTVPLGPPETGRRDLILEIGPATGNDFTGPLALRILCLDPALRAIFPDPQVPLGLTTTTLAPLVDSCQKLWWQQIFGSHFPKRRFQDVSEKPVSESVHRKDILPKLAQTGRELFIQIFRPSGPEYESTQNVGAALRRLMSREGLSITIRSRDFFVPWNLLYLGAAGTSDPAGFWGYQHVIEHDISRLVTSTSPFATQPRVAVHLDENIDRDKRFQEFRANARVVGLLKDYGIDPVPRNDLPAFQQGLLAGADEHIFYFCCHARAGKAEATGPQLFLTNPPPPPPPAPITPINIDDWLDECQALPGRPLVFMNACEAAQSGSFLYKGFASTFLSHYASSVIGPELEMPAVFARDFALKFFEQFFRTGPENSVGKILLRLRQEYMREHCNPLGLVYSLYRGGGLYLASHLPAGQPRAAAAQPGQP